MSLSVLLSVGAVAALSTFILLSYQGDLPNWGVLIAILVVTYFISWTWALMLYLRWRDKRTLGTPVTAMYSEELKGTVYGLMPGAEYQVMQTFTDYYKNEFQRGERLRFKERHFLPYHGGHTIIFDQRPLYLQEEENAAILSDFSEYISRVE
jgi:Domain of unknown function (DUF3601)